MSDLFCWSDRRGTIPRPSAWEANALPTELLSQNAAKLRINSQFSILNFQFVRRVGVEDGAGR